MSSAGRAKRDREKAKQERAALKRAKRQSDGVVTDPAESDEDADSAARITGPPASQEQVLAQIAALHQRFDDGALDFEDFEAAKNELMSRLNV